jgi:hypothetical protein
MLYKVTSRYTAKFLADHWFADSIEPKGSPSSRSPYGTVNHPKTISNVTGGHLSHGKEWDVLKNTSDRLTSGILWVGGEYIYSTSALSPVMSKAWGVPEISTPQLPCLCPEHPAAPPAFSDT